MNWYSIRELLFPLSIFFILFLLVKNYSFKVFYFFFAFLIILLSVSYFATKDLTGLFSPPPGGDSGTTGVRKLTTDITQYKNNLSQNYSK